MSMKKSKARKPVAARMVPAPTKAGAPAAAPSAPAPAASAKPNVSPQDQALYDRVMIAARRVIYGDPNDDQRFRMVVQRMAGARDQLGQTIGNITATVLANVQGSIQKAGRQVPSYILFHAGREVIADLVQIAIAAKFATQAQVAQLTKVAIFQAVETYKRAIATMGSAGAAPAAPPAAGAAPAAPAPAPAPAAPPAAPGIINTARG
jgi:pyruvate dehydrogenase E2 component (dihydrolipoamide acetyltransferase)